MTNTIGHPEDHAPSAGFALDEHEVRVLRVLCEDDEYAHDFAHIGAEAGLWRAEVQKAARSLRAKGLARFLRGLFNEDGELAGSGYACTPQGLALAASLPLSSAKPAEGESLRDEP